MVSQREQVLPYKPARNIEDITDSLDKGDGIDVIFLDFQKAFESVPHKRLLSKLQAYGIGGKILNWIEGFLCGRSHDYVTVRKGKSEEAEVTWSPTRVGIGTTSLYRLH